MVKKNEFKITRPDIDYGLPELDISANKARRKQTVAEKLVELGKMDNLQFEHYLARLFALKGYEVKYTPLENDFGADLIIDRNDEYIAVKCLLGDGVLGADAIDTALDAMRHYSVHKVMIVTTQMFTGEALRRARKKPIILVDKQGLIEDYLKMRV